MARAVNKLNKVILINFGGIGDQILFLPAIHAIKKFFKKDKIYLMTEPRSVKITRLTDCLDEKNIIEFNYKTGNKNSFIALLSKAMEFVKILRRENFDYVFCTGNSPLIPFVLFLTGIKSRFYIRNKSSKRYTARLLFEPVREFFKSLGFDEEAIDSNYSHPEIFLHLGADSRSKLLSNKIKSLIKEKEYSYRYIAVHPGTSKLARDLNLGKEWDAAGWANLISEILLDEPRTKIVFCAGPEDHELSDEIRKNLAAVSLRENNFIDLSHETEDLAELAYLFSEMDAVICHDSAPMHIAYSLGVKTIPLFSTTDHTKLIPEDAEHVFPVYSDKDGQWQLDEIKSHAMLELVPCLENH